MSKGWDNFDFGWVSDTYIVGNWFTSSCGIYSTAKDLILFFAPFGLPLPRFFNGSYCNDEVSLLAESLVVTWTWVDFWNGTMAMSTMSWIDCYKLLGDENWFY